MANNRDRYKALEPRYKFHWKGSTCYYCSDKSDTIDHVPPLSISYSYGAEELELRGAELLKVSACRECNVLLGNRSLLTLEERGVYLYRTLVARYTRVLHGKKFDYEEIDELGPNLRSYIQAQSDIKNWLERRLTFMENVFRV